MYHLRLVLGGIRSLSRQVVLKCVFMLKSNRHVNSEDLHCFSGVDRTRR